MATKVQRIGSGALSGAIFFGLAFTCASLLNAWTGYLWPISVTWDELEALQWSAAQCSFQTFDFSGSTEGEVYRLADGRYRGDVVTRASGQTRHTHTITRGGITYTWVDGYSEGLVLPIAAVQALSVDSLSPGVLNCIGWRYPDEKLFDLPRDVQFSRSSS